MSINTENKYNGLEKELEELFIAISENNKKEEYNTGEKREYESPALYSINKAQYKKLKTLLLFVHGFADEDNDAIEYSTSSDGLHIDVKWRMSSLYVSKADRSLILFSRIMILADEMNISITGLNEYTISFRINNVMNKLEVDQKHRSKN